MASRLRNKSAKVSLFAFQDMITTVTGVLIGVMLMLSIDVTRQTSRASETTRNDARDELEQARKQLAADTQTLRQKQADLSALTRRVFVLPDTDRSGKQPVLVVLSQTNGWCSRLGQTNVVEFKGTARRTEFDKQLGALNPQRDRLVFYVRPSGIAHFERCSRLARQRGFSVGSDAAEEEAQYQLAAP